MQKSECDKIKNTQMNRDRTTPPGTGMPMDRTTPPSTGMPMDRTAPPSTGMPMDRDTAPSIPPGVTTPRTGTPMNGSMTPRTGMPMNGGMTPRTGMPINGGMTPQTGMPNIFMPGNTPFNTPMGIPLYPLYGYDNCEDLERDIEYFMQMYPSSARRILDEINDECDKLEYDGSVMFDEYPDRVTLDRIIDRVYERVQDMDEISKIETYNVFFAPVRRRSLLRDFISIILLNELLNRRRRYRRRRRWF